MATVIINKKSKNDLKCIKTKDLNSGNYNFPDFLIIGPQRTGTTWLHHNLVFHPQIFMPLEKELFFFNNLSASEAQNKFTSDRLEWYSKKFCVSNPANISYLLKECLKNYSTGVSGILERLKTFFSGSLVKGEATASYAVMDETIIQDIVTLNPSMKVIMFIRHPYERAWSHAKKDLMREKNRPFEEISYDEITNFFAQDYQVRCGHYTEIMSKWEKYLQKDSFYIGIFDQIKESPLQLLLDIFNFLGVSSHKKYIKNQTAEKKINPTASRPIPKKYQEVLQKYFGEEIKLLNAKFNLNWHL